MPFKDVEKKREYNRERLRRIREKELERKINDGDLNAGLGVLKKDEKEEPKKKDPRHYYEREQDFSMDVKSMGDERQTENELESSGLGANAWGSSSDDMPKPKKKSLQDRLRSEFPDFSE
jgi:hypothetical protein